MCVVTATRNFPIFLYSGERDLVPSFSIFPFLPSFTSLAHGIYIRTRLLASQCVLMLPFSRDCSRCVFCAKGALRKSPVRVFKCQQGKGPSTITSLRRFDLKKLLSSPFPPIRFFVGYRRTSIMEGGLILISHSGKIVVCSKRPMSVFPVSWLTIFITL